VLQSQGEKAEQAADCLSLGPLGVPRIVADGMPPGMAEQQLHRRLFGEDGELHCMELAELALAGREENSAAEVSKVPPLQHRAQQHRGVVHVVQDQQCTGALVKLVESRAHLLVLGPVLEIRPELSRDRLEPLGQWLGRIHPEDAIRVGLAAAVRVFDRKLRLADAPHAGQSGRANGDGIMLAQELVELLEVLGPAHEVEISGELHKEGSCLGSFKLVVVAFAAGNCLADASGDVSECFFLIGPCTDGLAVPGQALEFSERGKCPCVDRVKNDRNHQRRAFLMTLHGTADFEVPDVVGVDEVVADQEQDDVGLVELPFDFRVPLGGGVDSTVVPILDDAQAPEYGEAGLEPVAQALVLVGVGIEQLGRRRGALRLRHGTVFESWGRELLLALPRHGDLQTL
jgi:hypothetical protein